jgi:hypothetical protein
MTSTHPPHPINTSNLHSFTSITAHRLPTSIIARPLQQPALYNTSASYRPFSLAAGHLVMRKNTVSAVLDLFCSNETEWKSHFLFDQAFIPPEGLALQPLVLHNKADTFQSSTFD